MAATRGQGDTVMANGQDALVDGFGRRIRYLRISMTDRCNYRCRYCMPERMRFLPRDALLSFEELDQLCERFIARGTRRIRLTGGEPLVRHSVMTFINRLSRHLESGALEEVTLTTNGSLLSRFAGELAAAGVRRINVFLDTLDEALFHRLTVTGKLGPVLDGIDAALAAGLKVKLNAVALAGLNEAELPSLTAFAHARGMDITFIETMPLGDVEMDRSHYYLPMAEIERNLSQHYTLEPIDYRSAGPARYVRLAETGGRVGFINPVSHSFCDSCDKVRLSCSGVLYTCLGHDHCHDLKAVLRGSDDPSALDRAIDEALRTKPMSHGFSPVMTDAPALPRSMSVLGG